MSLLKLCMNSGLNTSQIFKFIYSLLKSNSFIKALKIRQKYRISSVHALLIKQKIRRNVRVCLLSSPIISSTPTSVRSPKTSQRTTYRRSSATLYLDFSPCGAS